VATRVFVRMLPTRALADGVFAVSLDSAQFENHAAGTSDDSVVLLLFITSFAFLVPARTSFCLGRLWHAGVFTLMAALCIAHHTLNWHVGWCMETRQFLTLAHHGWAYFSFLQMCFLVLGPEDPHMQWIDHPSVQDTPRSSLAMAPPLHAIVVSRVLPLGAILFFLCSFSSGDDLHWQIVILSDVLLLFGCAAFWLHRDRRASMPKVLLRMRFWRRLWNHCALPSLLFSLIWVLIESSDSQVMHAVWQVLMSSLAVSIIRVVHDSGGDLSSEAETARNASPQNPVVARILLGSVAMFGLPTLLFSLAADWWSVGYWRWPLISKATHQLPGGYVVVIGFLPTLVAAAAAFWLISSTVSSRQADPEDIVLSKQFGCVIGYASVIFGFLTLAMPDPVFPIAHTLCMILFLCLMMVATLLTTLSSRYPLAHGMRSRCFLTLAIFVSVMSYLVLLILVQRYIPNVYTIPQWLLATTEYITLALPMIWPLTWGNEVQARWQGHKAWRSFGGSNLMA